MLIFMEHLNCFVSNHVATEEYVLLLEGHSSRKELECLDKAEQQSWAVVQSLAEASHFLQPCEEFVNKKFHVKIREMRDLFCEAESTITHSNRIWLTCAIRALQHITVADITKSSTTTGLWPMEFDFATRWLTSKERSLLQADKAVERLSNEPVNSRVRPLCAVRRTVTHTPRWRKASSLRRGTLSMALAQHYRKLQ